MEFADAVSEGEGGGSLGDWRLSGLRTSQGGEEAGAEQGMLSQSIRRQKKSKLLPSTGLHSERQEP